ncbi:MAG TPA: (d)CMP kinase [Nitrospirota bacterium]|nr:(d)CMP kinase [Nitrospirota bacterium]
MKKNGLVIAIDGPSGAGKSTAARRLAERLGYIYIDTGAMYRAIGWKAKREGIDPADEAKLADLCGRTEVTIKKDNTDPRFSVNGIDVTGEIRTPEMGMMASAVSKSPAVRARLLTLQRELGRGGGVVMDGRDIGTVVFPDADVKFYLEASAGERGKRRYLELKAKGMDVDRAQITKEIEERDRQDSGRALAPLKKADDALLIDSSAMSIDDVLDRMLSEIKEVKWEES